MPVVLLLLVMPEFRTNCAVHMYICAVTVAFIDALGTLLNCTHRVVYMCCCEKV